MALSIDNFKAVLAKKGGVAHANRFAVFFSPPETTLLNVDIQQIASSFLSDNLNITQNVINDPRDIMFLCESVSMPGRSISTLDFQAEKTSIKIPYSHIDSDISMSFLLTNDYYMRVLFDNWLKNIFDAEEYRAKYKEDYAVDITILQLNSQNIPVYASKLINAYPIDMSAIELGHSNENTLSRFEVGFAYDYYIPRKPISSIGDAAQSATQNLSLDNII